VSPAARIEAGERGARYECTRREVEHAGIELAPLDRKVAPGRRRREQTRQRGPDDHQRDPGEPVRPNISWQRMTSSARSGDSLPPACGRMPAGRG